ncbi:sensor histidine kinase [Mucilaginibacter arboris]|uniref:sensor histidine kinase n=1 Tax=Mucilaginibacter arboris TaxID=2682090 RepID=UPI0018DE0DFE|nr:histidine kinase [Mucilaginibacter arboris]
MLQPFDRLLSNMPFPSERNTGDMRPGENGSYGNDRRMEGPPPGKGFDHPIPPPDKQFGERPEHHGPPGGQKPGREHFRYVDTTSLFIFVMIIALSTAVEITQQWGLTEQRATIAEAGRANAELSFLKAQINPHFLFNTLNNIYTLAVTGNEHTAESIMKLSNIMRYVTDEVSEDFVPLQNELECIEDYIGLQQLRIGSKTQVDFTITGNPVNKIIPPLIFMTFIENIFKYGISKQENSILKIRIAIEEKTIALFCQNPVFNTKLDAGRKGIGITNTRQRLEHLYPGKYSLNISHENGLYTVNLALHA